MSTNKLLFIYITALSSFVKQDLDFLQKRYDVMVIKCDSIQSILKIIKYLYLTDLSYIWFGSISAAIATFFAKLFNKKVVIVAGGMDAANEPSINYGAMARPIYKYFVKFAFKYCDVVLAVSNFTKNEVLKHSKPKHLKVIYNGIDVENIKSASEKEDLVVTIANRYTLKGIDKFIESARYLPHIKFLVIGSAGSEIKNPPPNVISSGSISRDEVINLLSKAKVYCQLSQYESFGMGLVEGMACECVPVVTNKAALPEVVGDVGFVLESDNPKEVAKCISSALKMGRSSEARRRVQNKFSIKRRMYELEQTIESLLS